MRYKVRLELVRFRLKVIPTQRIRLGLPPTGAAPIKDEKANRRDLEVAVKAGEVQGGEAVVLADVDELAAALEDALGGVAVALEGGVVQDVEATLVAQREVDGRRRGQGVDDGGAVLADGVVQRRVAVRVLDVDVAAVVEQNTDAGLELLVDGHVQRRAAALVGAVHLGRALHQQLHHVRLVPAKPKFPFPHQRVIPNEVPAIITYQQPRT